MSWNQVVTLGLVVSIAAGGLGWRARAASPSSLRRRYLWSLRLVKGYGGILMLCVAVPLTRLAWLSWRNTADPEQRVVLLASALAAVLNLVLGFVAFGTAPTVVTLMLSRRLQKADASPQQ